MCLPAGHGCCHSTPSCTRHTCSRGIHAPCCSARCPAVLLPWLSAGLRLLPMSTAHTSLCRPCRPGLSLWPWAWAAAVPLLLPASWVAVAAAPCVLPAPLMALHMQHQQQAACQHYYCCQQCQAVPRCPVAWPGLLATAAAWLPCCCKGLIATATWGDGDHRCRLLNPLATCNDSSTGTSAGQ